MFSKPSEVMVPFVSKFMLFSIGNVIELSQKKMSCLKTLLIT